MSLRRFQWHLRRPGVAALTALLLLVAGVLCLNGVHAVHSSDVGHHHHHSSDAHCHADVGVAHSSASHSHSHSQPQPVDGDQPENCAICFFHSAPVALDFASAPQVSPQIVQLADVSIPLDADSGTVIVTLWSGRAPPFSSHS